jgi:hypothetical protein
MKLWVSVVLSQSCCIMRMSVDVGCPQGVFSPMPTITMKPRDGFFVKFRLHWRYGYIELMQCFLNIVQTSTEESSVSPDKMGFLLFTKRKKADRFIEPLLLDSVKCLTSSVKCLGFLLDHQLTQWKHVKQRVNKV